MTYRFLSKKIFENSKDLSCKRLRTTGTGRVAAAAQVLRASSPQDLELFEQRLDV